MEHMAEDMVQVQVGSADTSRLGMTGIIGSEAEAEAESVARWSRHRIAQMVHQVVC